MDNGVTYYKESDMYKCDSCGADTQNAPKFLVDENWWEPPFCDKCESREEEMIQSIKDRAIQIRRGGIEALDYCDGCGRYRCNCP